MFQIAIVDWIKILSDVRCAVVKLSKRPVFGFISYLKKKLWINFAIKNLKQKIQKVNLKSTEKSFRQKNIAAKNNF